MLASGIHTESGRALLSSVRFATTPQGDTFVTGLDTLVTTFERGDVIEVQGGPSSGKTQLLLCLAMTAILPQTWEPVVKGQTLNVYLGGKGKAVAFFDCTQRFDIERLASLLRSYLAAQLASALGPRLGPPPEQLTELEVMRCLGRLRVYTPGSTIELAATLLRLPADLASDHTSHDLAYVIVDGSSEFCWADQLEREQTAAALKGKGRATDAADLHLSPLRLLVSSLAHVRQILSPIVFLSQWVMREDSVSNRSRDDLPFYHHHLPPPYPHITSHLPPFDPSDPLRTHSLPNSDIPTIFLKWHIQIFAPPLQTLNVAKPFRHAFLKRLEGRGSGMVGFTAVLRGAGGKEVGSWNMDVLDDRIE
ncbi:hypothetical protein RQP46_003014 [Phenoliferia psychrophenolica]